jgi:glyoxylase-like metal-dependent hydrolase (beta-lactamase superfamily II)
VAGLAWSPTYLLAIGEPVLFEAGFHCAGRLYEEAIKGVVNGRTPRTLFLTHVHWDHCGAAAYLKKAFPGLKVAASRKSADILQRPNARALIATLSQDVTPLVARVPGIDAAKLLHSPFEPFEIDNILEDGQIIEIGDGFHVQVFAAPGHTRDMFSYYVPEKGILFATEAVGVLDQANQVITEFLVDYDMYMKSLNRLSALEIDILCQGHHFVFTDDDVKRFFDRSLAAACTFEKDVMKLLESEGGSVERVVQLIKESQYDTNKGVKQSEHAYLINLTTRVAHLAKRLER